MRSNHYSVTAGRYIRYARITAQIREYADSVGIRIIRAKVGDHFKIGIHLLEAEQFELETAIENAEAKGFEAIYLHTFNTWRAGEPVKRPALKLVVSNV